MNSLLLASDDKTTKKDNEFRIKRELVFEFVEKTKLIIDKEIKINFTTKGFCDVTIMKIAENPGFAKLNKK